MYDVTLIYIYSQLIYMNVYDSSTYGFVYYDALFQLNSSHELFFKFDFFDFFLISWAHVLKDVLDSLTVKALVSHSVDITIVSFMMQNKWQCWAW